MIDYQFLVELGLILGFSAYVVKKFGESKVKQIQAQARQITTKGPFQGISALVANAEQLRAELYKMRDETIQNMQKAGKGENEIKDATKAIEGRIKYAELLVNNKPWLQYVTPLADDLADTALKVVKGVSKGLG